MSRVYQVACSLDGFIAGPVDDFSWTTPEPSFDLDELYAQFDFRARFTFCAVHELMRRPWAPWSALDDNIAKEWWMNHLERCPSCGGFFPLQEGPTHPYLESSPGCAAACGRLFAQHYERMDLYGSVYRLANDAYAVQHPGRPSRQTINSAAIHLIRLCLTIEHGMPAVHANQAVLAAGRRKVEYRWLEPPADKGGITVADFRTEMDDEAHRKLLRQWAEAAWDAWAVHHDTIQQWLPRNWKRFVG